MQEEARAQEAAESPIPVGSHVELTGLVNKSEQNGWRGVVVGYKSSTGRVVVRVDDGSETTLPDKIATLAPLIREKIEGGANVYLGGLRGMVKPVEKALNAVSPIPLKDLKKAKKYASEVY